MRVLQVLLGVVPRWRLCGGLGYLLPVFLRLASVFALCSLFLFVYLLVQLALPAISLTFYLQRFVPSGVGGVFGVWKAGLA